MRPLVPTLNCVKLKDYLLVPVTIHTICMVLFMPTKTVGTHAATCDRVVLVFFVTDDKSKHHLLHIMSASAVNACTYSHTQLQYDHFKPSLANIHPRTI